MAGEGADAVMDTETGIIRAAGGLSPEAVRMRTAAWSRRD
jgi:hypothetical protein